MSDDDIWDRHIPDLPDSCQLNRLVQDWCAAVEAYQRRDPAAVANAIAPRELGETETYTRLFGLITIAAELIGAQHRKKFPPNPFGFYGLQVEDLVTGDTVDPDRSVKDANIVAAGRLIVAAANEDHEQMQALLRAHMPPDGLPDRSEVLFDLLGIYCARYAEERA